ncbi:MAG: YbjQ family protein [Verrucomicrobiota bacterium]
MIVSTTDQVAGKKIVKTLGLVKGNTIRTRSLGHDIMAVLRHLVGGEVLEYTKMVAESREQALDRMVADAQAIKADAVVGVHFATNSMMHGAAELLAYGTAVQLEDDEG